jgi:YidC/Oxa1 family membrane protein insertase
VIDPIFLGLVNLAKGSVVMAAIAGALQYVQTKMITNLSVKSRGKDEEADPMDRFSDQMQKYTLYVFPLITVFIFYKLPSALSLYWITTSIFSIAQQYIILRKGKPVGTVALEAGA